MMEPDKLKMLAAIEKEKEMRSATRVKVIYAENRDKRIAYIED